MKKVRFRGKPTETFTFDFVDTVYSEKDFVYGALIYAGDQPYIVGETIDVTEDGVSFEFWVPVKPETVGQYTGEKDIDGNEIYMGDILLKHHEYPYEESFVVRDICDIYDVDSPDEKSKVIGNIHDEVEQCENTNVAGK